MSWTYRCEHCQAIFEHPEVEECETVDGHCTHLMNAGWRPVWLRAVVELSSPRRIQLGRSLRRDRHIFTRGGWICSTCADCFLGPRRRRLPPNERNLRSRRGKHQEGHTR